MQSYQDQAKEGSVGEIKFNLMSLVPSRLDALKRELGVCAEAAKADVLQRIGHEEEVCRTLLLTGSNG
jgi:hypothetical protein